MFYFGKNSLSTNLRTFCLHRFQAATKAEVWFHCRRHESRYFFEQSLTCFRIGLLFLFTCDQTFSFKAVAHGRKACQFLLSFSCLLNDYIADTTTFHDWFYCLLIDRKWLHLQWNLLSHFWTILMPRAECTAHFIDIGVHASIIWWRVHLSRYGRFQR